jgi:hypothetical protein
VLELISAMHTLTAAVSSVAPCSSASLWGVTCRIGQHCSLHAAATAACLAVPNTSVWVALSGVLQDQGSVLDPAGDSTTTESGSVSDVQLLRSGGDERTLFKLTLQVRTRQQQQQHSRMVVCWTYL